MLPGRSMKRCCVVRRPEKETVDKYSVFSSSGSTRRLKGNANESNKETDWETRLNEQQFQNDKELASLLKARPAPSVEE